MILIRGESQNQGAQERENAQPDAWFLCSRLNEIDPLLVIGIYMTLSQSRQNSDLLSFCSSLIKSPLRLS